VKAGQVLAVIAIPELEQQLVENEAQLASKQSSLETARQQVDHDSANVTLQDVTLKRQEALFSDHWVPAQMRVFCDVPENDVPYLHIGDPAIVKPIGFDGKPFIGKVTRSSLRLDPGTRNMRTEIDLANPEERLYPGMYAEVSLEMNRRPDALTVPAASVGADGDRTFVDAITDNRVTRRAVKTGLTDNGRIEVTAGLSEETPVVTTIKSAPSLGTAVQPLTVNENS
jgi:multidrug efflux pump subunit AcrA (membrane-fusion protein)